MILSLGLLISSCDKNELEKDFSANYTGTFIRTNTSPIENPATANVTIQFTDTSFSGTSDVNHYPAICSGTFRISQTKLEVVNKCAFTADFDWTYIFKGQYNYELKNDSLLIWREYENGVKDIYKLAKAK